MPAGAATASLQVTIVGKEQARLHARSSTTGGFGSGLRQRIGCVLTTLSVLTVGACQVPHVARNSKSLDGGGTLRTSATEANHLAEADRMTVVRALQTGRRRDESDSVEFMNYRQRMWAEVGPSAAVVSGLAGTSVRFTTPRLGRTDTAPEKSASYRQPLVHKHGPRVEWSRREGGVSVTEWWTNELRGLEQGVVIHQRPAGTGALRMIRPFETTLDTALADDSQSVVFSDSRGERFRYTDLKAWDAHGRILPTYFALEQSALIEVVDDRSATYPVTIDPTWYQKVYLKADYPDPQDHFGYSVAVSGDTMVVGAWGEGSASRGVNANADDNSAEQSGAAYVFVRSGSTWTLEAYLKATNADAGDLFGWSVAISGNTLVVGAPGEAGASSGVQGNQSSNTAPYAGAAYVFTRSGGVWTQQAYLKASNAEASDSFGFAVGVSGTRVVVGAPQEDGAAKGVDGAQAGNASSNSGAAYVFTRNGNVWSQSAYLKAINTGADDRFGTAVAISQQTVIVGASGEDSRATGVGGDPDNDGAPQSGAAYVYVFSNGIWTPQAYLKASNTDAGDWFGVSVAVSGDTAVVGAPFERGGAPGVNGDPASNTTSEAGAVYSYLRNGGGWGVDAYLKSSAPGPGQAFGWAVALDGDELAVGVPWENSQAGAVATFARSGGRWTVRSLVRANHRRQFDRFGASVGIANSILAVGAPQEDGRASGVNGDDSLTDLPESGAAYVFLPASVTVAPNQWPVGASGGTTPVTLTVSPADLPWSATSSADWLVMTPSVGTGSSTVTVSALPTTSEQTRTATVTIAGEAMTVTQAPGTASFSVDPASWSVESLGGVRQIAVTSVLSDSPWTARAADSWLVVSPSAGTGSGVVTLTASASVSTQARTTTVSVAGRSVSVTQAGQTPTFTVSSDRWSVGAEGGTQTLALQASHADAPWMARSSSSWLSVLPDSGVGSGAVVLTTLPTSSSQSRTATVLVAGRTIVVTQAGGTPTFTVEPTAWDVGAGGGVRQVRLVSALVDSVWSASASPSWLTVSPKNGAGSSTITLRAENTNSSQARVGEVMVAGKRIVVAQEGGQATLTVSPTTWAIGAVGGSQTVTVTSDLADARWTASSSASWLTVTPASGIGGGAISLRVAPTNSSQARTGEVTVAGRQIVVSQEAGRATLTVSPTTWAVGAVGGSQTVTITSDLADARWTASSSASWLTVTPSSGSGTTSLTMVANPSSEGRTATVTVAGQSIQVTQSAPSVTFTVSPEGWAPDADGGAREFSVTASVANAPWEVTSDVAWISASSPAAAGSGRITLTATANPGSQSRSAVVTVAGRRIPVTQAGRVAAVVLTPSEWTAAETGQTTAVTLSVTTTDTPWTVTVADPWISVSPMSGRGRAILIVAVQAQAPQAAARTGQFSVAGQKFRVFQRSRSVPAPPVALVAKLAGQRLQLRWSPSESASTSDTYLVDYGLAPGHSMGSPISVGLNRELIVNDVPPGRFFIRIRASNEYGLSAPSNEVELAVGNTGVPPARPQRLTASVSGDNVRLSWSPSDGDDETEGYQVEAGLSPGARDAATVDVGQSLVFQVAQVPPGRFYVRVRGRNRFGVSEPTDDVLVVVGSLGEPPPRPLNLRVNAVGAAATFSWSRPEGASGAVQYRLDAGTAPGLSDIAMVDLGDVTAFRVEGVPPGVFYVRVRAVNQFGSSPPSNEVTLRHSPPTVPLTSVAREEHVSGNRREYLPASELLRSSPVAFSLSGEASPAYLFVQWSPPGSLRWLTGYRIDVTDTRDGRIVRSTHVGLAQRVILQSLPQGDYLIRAVMLNDLRVEAVSEALLVSVGGSQAGPAPE